MRPVLRPVSRPGLAVLASTALGVVALVGGACNTQPSWQQFPTTNKPRIHVMIQFDDTTVQPDVAHIKAGGTVSWVNYATQYRGSVVLPHGIQQDLTCKAGPDFLDVGNDVLQSIPIGGVDDDVDLPCPLKAGTYDYQINLYSAQAFGVGSGYAGGMENPQLTMKGKLVVE
jgi:plastocyanin